MKFAIFLLVLTVCSLSKANPSYIFGRTPAEGLGPLAMTGSARYATTLNALAAQGYRPLIETYGSTEPSDLKIVIGDSGVDSFITEVFVDTLSYEKPTLMKLYRLSNSDYNQLALMAFGIMGQETKYGTSPVYKAKEFSPNDVYNLKVIQKKWSDVKTAVRVGDSSILLNSPSVVASRGLTQIKEIPYTIRSFYCFTKDDLSAPRAAAISTLAFLAESLQTTRAIARNKELPFIDRDNVFDYVLYVYFGSKRQLAVPIFDRDGHQLNETATPDHNLYVQHVKENIRSLVLTENHRRPMAPPHDIACSNTVSASN